MINKLGGINMPKIRSSFDEQERKLFTKITLEKLKEGKYKREIAKILGISELATKKIVEQLISGGKITQEEIDQAIQERELRDRENDPDRKKILEGLKQGKNITEISKGVRFKPARVGEIVRELIQEGKITQREIDEAREQFGPRAELKEKVCKLFKQKKTYEQMKEELGISTYTISKMKKELLQEGRLTEDDFVKEVGTANDSDGQEVEKRDTVSVFIKEEVHVLLLRGLSDMLIKKELNKPRVVILKCIEALKAEGKITSEIIEDAKQERRLRDKEKVYRLSMQGYSQKEMVEQILYSYLSYIQELIKELKKEGRLTDKKIQNAKFENNEKENREFVLERLRKGWTRQDISDADPNGYLTVGKVKGIEKRLIEEGVISEEEIKKARKARMPEKKKEKKKENIGPYDEKIRRLFLFGFSQNQISQILELNVKYVANRKAILKMQKKLTQIRINNAKENREKNVEERRRKIEKMLDDLDFSDLEVFNEHIEYCKALRHVEDVDEKDVNLLAEVIETTPESITLSNISFITSEIIKRKGQHAGIQFMNRCITTLDEGSEERKKLEEGVKELKIFFKKQEARRMLDENYAIEYIADVLTLRTIDVIDLKRVQEQEEKRRREQKGQEK